MEQMDWNRPSKLKWTKEDRNRAKWTEIDWRGGMKLNYIQMDQNGAGGPNITKWTEIDWSVLK